MNVIQEKYTIESVLKSNLNIRHLFDVACQLDKDEKIPLKGIIFICKSITVRNRFLDVLKLKAGIVEYDALNIDVHDRAGDVVARITHFEEKKFLLCNSVILKINEYVRNLLAEAIEKSTCEIQVGKGAAAQYFSLSLPNHTYIFTSEEKSSDTDFLSRNCEHMIVIDDEELKRICEPLVVAIFAEQGFTVDVPTVKSIAMKYQYDIDLCAKAIRRISEFMELNSIEDKRVTQYIFNQVEGELLFDVTSECLKILRRLNCQSERILDRIQKIECEYHSDEHNEIIESLEVLINETTEVIRRLN